MGRWGFGLLIAVVKKIKIEWKLRLGSSSCTTLSEVRAFGSNKDGLGLAPPIEKIEKALCGEDRNFQLEPERPSSQKERQYNTSCASF